MQNLEMRYLTAKRALFDAYYKAKLNDRQAAAVCTARGPLLVLAGAGSGKTTVLVKRIAHLIKYGIAYESDRIPEGLDEGYVKELEDAAHLSPEEIAYILPEFIEAPCPPWGMLAITFTNKAAKEIKDRLLSAFDDPDLVKDIWSGTFHSICLRILHKYGDRVGLASGFSIYDTDDKKRVLLDIMKELDIDTQYLPVKTVANEISRAKDELTSPEDFPVTVTDLRRKHIKEIYHSYNARLLKNNAVDFDDIIMKTVLLLEDNDDAREYYQKKFRYISVDEYQDTNMAQFRLTELLSGGYRNIMVVGDDDQSIYKFRGATIENILNFDRVYADAKVIKLEQNYRSTKTILAAANAIISHNEGRHEKSLWCDAAEGDKISLYRAQDGMAEARYIVDKISSLRVFHNKNYRDFAVLYRLNELSRGLEAAFAKSGIPYRVLGGQRFHDRKEIRDMTAYLHLIANHADNERLKRIINEPKRKLGQTTVDAVEAIAAEENIPMLAVMEKAGDYPALGRVASRLLEFASLICRISPTEKTPSAILEQIYIESGYRAMLVAEGEVSKERIASVQEYINGAVEYEKRVTDAGEVPTLYGYLEEVSLVSDVDKYDDAADAVVLMTIHSAKGLEFPTVFLCGMEEQIFPSSQCTMDPSQLEEERRLAYVAVTRAKEALYLTHTKERMIYGRTTYNPLSRFVADEIPKELVEDATPQRPDRPSYGIGGRTSVPTGAGRTVQQPSFQKEMGRTSFMPKKTAPLKLLEVGTRVSHNFFGNGTILSSKTVGGDILYTIAFDSGEEKRLMATFAKLKEI